MQPAKPSASAAPSAASELGKTSSPGHRGDHGARVGEVAGAVLQPGEPLAMALAQACDDRDRPGHLGVLRDVIQVDGQARMSDGGDQRVDVADQAVVGDVGIEERRQHERAGEAELARRARQPHRLGERRNAGADHEAVERQAGVGDRVHHGESLLDAERGRLAGRAEQVDGVAAAVEQGLAVGDEARVVGGAAGIDRRRGRGDDAARPGGAHGSRRPRPGTRKSKSQPSSACSTVRWNSAA